MINDELRVPHVTAAGEKFPINPVESKVYFDPARLRAVDVTKTDEALRDASFGARPKEMTYCTKNEVRLLVHQSTRLYGVDSHYSLQV